jgi:hypothetical protein
MKMSGLSGGLGRESASHYGQIINETAEIPVIGAIAAEIAEAVVAIVSLW